MIRLVVFVAGVVVGAIGTLAAQNPKKVAAKVRVAVATALKKLREAFPGEGPVDGAEERA
jgi:hypothetical protein